MCERQCPLCDRPMKSAMSLYNAGVCRKCYYGFVNRRHLAWVIDAVLWRFLQIPIVIALAVPFAFLPPTRMMELIATVTTVLLTMTLFCLKDGFVGMSPGKALFGVRVVDDQTLRPISFGRSFRRNLPLMIPFMPIVVAFTLGKGKRIGDRWSKCRVIWRKYQDNPIFTGSLVCRSCGYDLHGNVSGACPECGTEFQPIAPPTIAYPPAVRPALAA